MLIHTSEGMPRQIQCFADRRQNDGMVVYHVSLMDQSVEPFVLFIGKNITGSTPKRLRN